jgi:hypothetical protein
MERKRNTVNYLVGGGVGAALYRMRYTAVPVVKRRRTSGERKMFREKLLTLPYQYVRRYVHLYVHTTVQYYVALIRLLSMYVRTTRDRNYSTGIVHDVKRYYRYVGRGTYYHCLDYCHFYNRCSIDACPSRGGIGSWDR